MPVFPWIKTTLATIVTIMAAPVFAQTAMPMPSNASTEEVAAYAVFEKYCARCHQDGALKPGLEKAKSGFGHVLDIRRLAQDTKFVVQGDVLGSKLHNVMGEYSFPSMPDDCSNSTCYPTQSEMDAVATWIELLGQTEPERPFVSLADLYAAAQDDLRAQPTNRRDRIRYFSLRAMHNDADVSQENLDGYRSATVKLINALSWNPRPFRAEPVDANGVLIRVFLPDLDWTHDTWGLLESAYPYGMTSATDPNLSQLQYMAGTQVPVIRADWFAAKASSPPLYYDILKLPDTAQGLHQLLRIDLNRNIQDEQVVRAGFQDSGVSTNNRLIERHPMGTGFFWTSYDFAGSVGRQSFFEYPLGPEGAYPAQRAFKHDGGESIFTLPNGFHAYYLNTSDGARLDVGPTTIVRDDDYTDGTGEVVNGISCISCHSKGIRLNDDRVREVAMNDLSLSPQERQTINAIYPGQQVVSDWMKRDTEAFFAALSSAGLNPEVTAGGLEPVRGLFVYHVDAFVDFTQAASEMGLTPDALRARIAFVGPELASLMLRLDQSPIARDEWTATFPLLVERVTDYRAIPIDQRQPVDLSYSVQQAVDTYAPTPTHTAPAPTYDPVANGVATQSALTIYTDKPAYKIGDGIRIIIEPRADCRLTLINIDNDNKSCVLYPHPAFPDTPIKGGTQYIFPPQGSLTASEVGTETILAICNASPEAISIAARDTSQVSCDPGQRATPYASISNDVIVREVFTLNPGSDTNTADNGATYRALSTQNPNIAKAQISVPVTQY